MSEVLALEVSDLSLDVELPTIRVRSDKGIRARIVPVHPELGAVVQTALEFRGSLGAGGSHHSSLTRIDALSVVGVAFLRRRRILSGGNVRPRPFLGRNWELLVAYAIPLLSTFVISGRCWSWKG